MLGHFQVAGVALTNTLATSKPGENHNHISIHKKLTIHIYETLNLKYCPHGGKDFSLKN